MSFGVSCSLSKIVTKLIDQFRWKKVREFIHQMIPDLAYVSLFGEFNGTWCGPDPLKVTWSLFSLHGELGIGDSRHGGIKRSVGYPSGLYIAGEFQWNLNDGKYVGGDIVAGINGNIRWFHFTNEISLLEIFGIK